MLKYDKNYKCPKCGAEGIDISLRWEDGRNTYYAGKCGIYHGARVEKEHLHLHCKICSFCDIMECKDSPKETTTEETTGFYEAEPAIDRMVFDGSRRTLEDYKVGGKFGPLTIGENDLGNDLRPLPRELNWDLT